MRSVDLAEKGVHLTRVADVCLDQVGFAAAGLKKPDISILSEEFLKEVSQLPQKNLAVELLRKLLNDEIKTRSHRNVVKSRLFSTLLESSIRKYQNRAIQAAQVIEEHDIRIRHRLNPLAARSGKESVLASVGEFD